MKTVLAQDHCYSDDLSEQRKDKGIVEAVKMLSLWREMEQWEFGFLMNWSRHMAEQLLIVIHYRNSCPLHKHSSTSLKTQSDTSPDLIVDQTQISSLEGRRGDSFPAPCGDRTHDHTLMERMLCQLS